MQEIILKFNEDEGQYIYAGLDLEQTTKLTVADALMGLTAAAAHFLVSLKEEGGATSEEVGALTEELKEALDQMVGGFMIQSALDEIEENFGQNREFDKNNPHE